MTRAQFAMAIRADEKWVENSARLLGKRLRYTADEARSVALIRVLSQEVGITLFRAAQLADEILKQSAVMKKTALVVGGAQTSSAAVSIDMARFYSTYAAALSAALDIGGPRRRGRRSGTRGRKGAVERAVRYGVDMDLLREGLRLSPLERLERLDENAAFLNAIRRT
ncbi:MAG TPA: hypothetical protein VM099_10830 [Gemmatimonadaceae bacterium]|nr:hypothetical protein [Gemmatimonadaceae bacterium]